jgi:hypothetical protein
VICVRVPVDLHAVATSGSPAFAYATPLRVSDLVALAVREAVGARAPLDKFQRSLRTTLTGLQDGRFLLTVDGRLVARTDDVVMCRQTARVQFFLPAVQGSRI